MTSVRLRLWREKGRLAVIPDENNTNSINDSLRFICGAIDYERGKALVKISADATDAIARTLTPAQQYSHRSDPQNRCGRNSGSCPVPYYFDGNANVTTDPPVGTLPSTKRLARMPPMPDATVTYCLPLWVYVIAVALMLEPV